MSGMSTGLTGLQNTAQSLVVSAKELAKGPQPYKPEKAEQERFLKAPEAPEAVREAQEPAANENRSDLAVEALNLKTDRVTYEASLQFLQVQSGLLGTALDMKA